MSAPAVISRRAGRQRSPRRLPTRAALAGLLLAVAIAAGIALATTGVGAGTGPASRGGGSGGPGKGGSSPSAPTRSLLAPSQVVRFSLVLRLPGAAALRQALAAIEDPHSPQYRHFIGPRSFGARFGLSIAQLARLRSALSGAGVKVRATYPQRTQLEVTATAAAVRRLFGVQLRNVTGTGGRHWHEPIGTPRVPAGLGWALQAVTGLDTRPRMVAHDVPSGGLTPAFAASAYGVAPLYSGGISGQGMRIAIISFSSFDPNDPAAFDAAQGINGPPLQVVSVDGGTNDTSGQVESDLDIEVVRGIAPQAQIVFYELPQSGAAYSDAINKIVADGISIISTSWGQCEAGLDPAERTADNQALSAAVAAGVTMFAASGDSGAYDCQQADASDHSLTVDWPAGSANAVAVGGTRLYLDGNGSYVQEGGWEDTLSQAGGGGGLSQGVSRPSWQTGAGVQNQFSNGSRQVPDVSANADPGTPWAIYTEGHGAEVGGTSAATPFWAASMLLVSQYAASHGAGKLGFVAPILYALASGGSGPSPFHDVTLGGNRYYPATAGWDFATGLGSPDVNVLAHEMVTYLKAHGR